MTQNRTGPGPGSARDAAVEAISQRLTDYAKALGGVAECDPEILELHYAALTRLAAAPLAGDGAVAALMRELDLAVARCRDGLAA